MKRRVFFPQGALDLWVADDRVELTGESVVLKPSQRSFPLLDAVRVIRELTGEPDPYGLVGKVKLRADLEARGAEILEGSMVLGDNAFDIVPGFIATVDASGFDAAELAKFAAEAG